MKKRAVMAVTLGVWMAAVGSAAALTYDLNRPPTLVLTPAAPRGASETMGMDGVEPSLVDAPSAHVTRWRVPPSLVGLPPAASSEEPVLDISDMSCAEWRSLDMGSGRVQICEPPPVTPGPLR